MKYWPTKNLTLLRCGLMDVSASTWINRGHPFNLVAACLNLQGDGELVLAATVFHRAAKIEIGISGLFNDDRRKWLEFDWRLFR